nr:hypothetical protein [uncultured Rhodopila sp.]
MFERWTDIVTSLGLAAGVAYVVWEIGRRQKQLRELFDVLDGDDASITSSLEDLVNSGRLKPFAGAASA